MIFRWTVLKISLVVIMTFSFLAIVLGFLSYKNINLLLGFWGKKSTISVYLKPDILDSEKSTIFEFFKTLPEIDEARFVDRKKAAEDFKLSLGEYANGLLTQDELIDLLPESYVISLKSSLSWAEQKIIFEKIAATAKTMTGIEEVTYGGEWIKKFSKLDGILRTAGLLLFVLLSVCTAVISAFMVSSLVDESKQEIEVYSLVGATRWHIYKKFINQVGYFHLISMSLSLVLSYLIFVAVKNYFLKAQGFLFISDSLMYFSAFEFVVFILIFTLFIYVGALLALNSALRKLNLYASE